ncbi:GAF domain-containing protein [uncultured Lutibacter sp.]|uniref:GAF domain-containing protein n=1 Tax=uncultured Lutibacter sp. TaxID=437739 RepID=UPI0026116E42|nr:GAF domain-containing protein [uncultured Lutibacter sp.]
MKIIPSNYTKTTDLPLKQKISFEAIFEYLEETAKDKNNYLHSSATQLLEEYKDLTILREGFEDFSYLDIYRKEIGKLLDILFPDLLQSNEIKAASIPFEFTTFKLSKRFQQILDDAGDDFELKLRNFEESNIYILACTFILAYHYNVKIDFGRPFFYDIPNLKTGITKHYRTLFNGDFFKVKPLKDTKLITDEDVKILLDNFNNIDVWREKFPPNSYEFKGFGIVNLFDVTSDQSLSNLRENLLKKDQHGFSELENSISNLYSSNTIKIGFSTYNSNNDGLQFKNYKKEQSFIQLDDCSTKECKDFFCGGIINKVFKNNELLAISDIEKYGRNTDYNGFYKVLKSQNILSVILVPLQLKEGLLGVLELVSTKKYELNSINAYKLEDVVPVFKIAVKRYMEEFENSLESVIQENYTSLHPTVKWKFYEQAENYLFNLKAGNKTSTNLKSIVFENVIPLYGQSDIKGSSTARNNAIQADLIKQLKLASIVIERAAALFNLPIYSDLLFRIEECLVNIKKGLNSGDEVSLTDFLKKEIYPVFNHLKTLDKSLKEEVDNYTKQIDPQLQVVYDKRKKYEESVTILNDELAKFIDSKQVEAQKMFPHYFERYKTDGIDYNMYIGQSLVQNSVYNEMYLHNLRLWQLQLMCEVENIAHNLKDSLEHPLEIASLILVHSTPLAIKFRMDEKKFDVDGAYNIRYEIIKKRIDKALIKNTTERLTQPGKIAIVYSQKSDADEYIKYIKHLQSKKQLLPTIENVELKDLQGVFGLKALRVSVNYNNTSEDTITLNDLMNVIKDETLN